MRKARSLALAVGLWMSLGVPAGAAELKAEIDDLLGRLDAATRGFVKWDGADAINTRQEGEAETVALDNARLSIKPPDADPDKPPTRIVFDHIEIRRNPAPDNAASYRIDFPRQTRLTAPEGQETTLTLDKANAAAVIDNDTRRARETSGGFAGARLEVKDTGDWVGFGPLTFSSKMVAEPNGAWTSPIDVELKAVEFFVGAGPVAGAIDRIAYNARSAGPDLAAMNRLRARIDELREQTDTPPEARLQALLDMLPSLPSLLSQSKGEMVVEGIAARAATGEPLVALAKASIGGGLVGLSGDNAALRITLRHEGLALAPKLVPPDKVPQRAVVDIGLEDVATAPLRKLLEIARTAREWPDEAGKQRAQQQALAAAAMLNPTFRIYDIAVDTPEAGVDATGEIKGSPLAPKGYTAAADIAVRGFDAVPALIGAASLNHYLPVLKEIGTPGTGPDGVPRLTFHLASAPQKWITVNGADITPWFASDTPAPGQPRTLRPAEPPVSGADVQAVQRALAAAGIAVPPNGSYDGPTAAAVTRFQKQNGLNPDGVVDVATRQKLGVKPEPVEPAPANPPAGPGPRDMPNNSQRPAR